MARDLIVVVSSDVVGQKMAGPAIRATELARAIRTGLGAGAKVVLAAPNDAPVDGLEVVSFRKGGLARLVRSARVVIGQGLGVPIGPLLAPGHALVLDFYDPNPVELMAFHRDSERRKARRSQEHLRHRLVALAKRGDLFLCATERQRDFWIGLLAAAGRLSWEADRSDPNLDDLLTLVPFGLPQEPPVSREKVLKGVRPGIGPEDKVLLWGGGIWNWFDPLTVIRAMGRVAEKRSDIKLLFLGVAHPNPKIPAMAMTTRAFDLTRELGLMDRVVFFNEGWVEYQKRVSFLMESDLAILAAGQDLETHLAFRTRLLDAIWAGLPMIVTAGDYFAGLIGKSGLGRVVPVGDDRSMAEAILELVDNPTEMKECGDRLADLATELTWANVAEPLIRFCKNPVHHPGAPHSIPAEWGLAAGYYWGVARVVARYGGLTEQIKRRLQAKSGKQE